MTRVVGIDEAGRGPVIGPLVICGVSIEEGQEKELELLGVKDSKLLMPKQRERIAKELERKYKFHTVVVQPHEIDEVVGSNSKVKNLNWLEADKQVEIIKALKPEKVIVDCPSPNCKAFTSFLYERLPNKKTVIVGEHKAEAKYPVVAAASIIAKVRRDEEVERIKKHVGENFGSGYMHDPRTKAFTEKNWDKHPEIFRHSWAPYRKLVEELFGKQQKLDGYGKGSKR